MGLRSTTGQTKFVDFLADVLDWLLPCNHNALNLSKAYPGASFCLNESPLFATRVNGRHCRLILTQRSERLPPFDAKQPTT